MNDCLQLVLPAGWDKLTLFYPAPHNPWGPGERVDSTSLMKTHYGVSDLNSFLHLQLYKDKELSSKKSLTLKL